jgi:hypothetical protein
LARAIASSSFVIVSTVTTGPNISLELPDYGLAAPTMVTLPHLTSS